MKYPKSFPLSIRRLDGSIFTLAPKQTAIVGILNLTPDSFSDGGQYVHKDDALSHAYQMVEDGADVLDIGAESTRPFADKVQIEQEWDRLKEVLLALTSARLPVALSIDTRNIQTAKRAADMGISVLNLPFPDEMIENIKSESTPTDFFSSFDAIVLMHARGNPNTMQTLQEYPRGLMVEVIQELQKTANRFQTHLGPTSPTFIYDPGIGFAKSATQSLSLLSGILEFQQNIDGPVMVGASRKSWIGAITGLAVEERLGPSLAAALWAKENGVSMLRVHDVKQTKAAFTVWDNLHPHPAHAAHLLYTHHLHLE